MTPGTIKQKRRARSIEGDADIPLQFFKNNEGEQMLGDGLAQQDEDAKERRKKRYQQQLKRELQAYLNKQDKFAGAMKLILTDHKDKTKQLSRAKSEETHS